MEWQRLRLGLPVLAAAAALAASWQRWINPLIDSGREMDVPWRLLQGERLYRDITYYYGPLGPWANALALRLFGDRWLSLELVCAPSRRSSSCCCSASPGAPAGSSRRLAATTLAAALCMGAPRGGIVLFPYSSSSLFALAGGLLALDAAASRRPWRRRRLGSLGLAVALASRLELGARRRRRSWSSPGYGPVPRGDGAPTSGSWPAARSSPAALRRRLRSAFRGAGCSPTARSAPSSPCRRNGSFLYLKTSPAWAARRTAAGWAVSLLLDGLLLAAAAWLACPAGRPARRPLFACRPAAPRRLRRSAPGASRPTTCRRCWPSCRRLALAAAWSLWRRPLDARGRAQFLLFFFSAAIAARVFFGLTVGPRMGPNSALPLPGLLATAAVLGFDLLAPRLPAPAIFRRRLAAIFAVIGALFLYRIERLDRQPQIVELQTSAGALRLPATRSATIAQVLKYLELNAREGDTLTAFPESGFFNFVTGLRSPLRQDLILPGVLTGSRETAAEHRIDDAGPKYVLLCNRPTAEFGPEAFGRDYAVELWRDVDHRYGLSAAFGSAGPTAPVGARDFFIRVYERNQAAIAPARLASTGLRHQPGWRFAVVGE